MQFLDAPKEGTTVKIRCHCNSQKCIAPFEGRASWSDKPIWDWAAGLDEVGVRFLQPPASPQGVQPYTVLFTRLAARFKQAPKWGHVVMAGVL